MDKHVEVAIIGAGSAGLSALKEVRKKTENFVLINDGPYGTTCARVGCMPSKVLIQIANDYYHRHHWKGRGIHGEESVSVAISEVLKSVRVLRDRFVAGVLKSTAELGDRNIVGRARFLGPSTLQVGKLVIQARRTIIATGSRPFVPEAWKNLGDKLLTSDTIFEQEDLPKKIAVIGLGAIGLELGQALARLGIQVTAFDRSTGFGGLTDPQINTYAAKVFASELALFRGEEATVKKVAGQIVVQSNAHEARVDAVVASLGRRPNIDDIGLETTGSKLDKNGSPLYDPTTLRLGDLPIFIAGDADADRPLLHEAADEGHIAGYNSVRDEGQCFRRRTRLGITFSEPNLASAGESFTNLKPGFVTGEVSFEAQGRSLILGENKGLLHVYADADTGKLLGAEMMAPRGEHLAHLLAWAIQAELTVFDALQMPFYHPVVEEGLRTALRDAALKVKGGKERQEIAFCEPSPLSPLC